MKATHEKFERKLRKVVAMEALRGIHQALAAHEQGIIRWRIHWRARLVMKASRNEASSVSGARAAAL